MVKHECRGAEERSLPGREYDARARALSVHRRILTLLSPRPSIRLLHTF